MVEGIPGLDREGKTQVSAAQETRKDSGPPRSSDRF